MQRTDNTGNAKMVKRRMGSSTTLNRKYVKRPSKATEIEESESDIMAPETIERSVKIRRFYSSKKTSDSRQMMEPMSPSIRKLTVTPMAEPEEPMMESQEMGVQPHPLQSKANSRMQARKSVVKKERKMTAKELKDKAIKEALATASVTEASSKTSKKKKSKATKLHFGFGRVVLALSCAAVAVFSIVYFVNLNMPDVSLKVAAMQTGINASYPTYVPRDYALSSITSENKKIVLEFKNAATNEAFTITEETSSWDSNALMNGYVKETYGDSYQVVKEQGLTLYINGSNAAWVNGGVVYKITASNGALTNKQIKTIATSL